MLKVEEDDESYEVEATGEGLVGKLIIVAV